MTSTIHQQTGKKLSHFQALSVAFQLVRKLQYSRKSESTEKTTSTIENRFYVKRFIEMLAFLLIY